MQFLRVAQYSQPLQYSLAHGEPLRFSVCAAWWTGSSLRERVGGTAHPSLPQCLQRRLDKKPGA